MARSLIERVQSDKVEPGGSLPGENPFTDDVRDARAWITVYEQLLGLAERQLISAPEDERLVIESRLFTYRKRLDFWEQRHFALAGIVVDEGSRTLGYRGAQTRLTAREFSLFTTLAAMCGQFLAARQLVQRAWNDASLSNEELRIYVSTLRRKLHAIAAGDIINRRGFGYMLELPAGSTTVATTAGEDSAEDGILQLQPLVAPQL